MINSCPSCLNSFCPGPLTTPLLLSCRHSICRACLQHSSLLQCPVISCQAHLPRLAVDMFPVNCHLLGEVMIRQSRDSVMKVKSEKLDHDKKVYYASRSALATIVARSKASVVKLEKAKQMINVVVSDRCYEEAATQLSSHFAGCHAQLEIVGDKVTKTLRQEEEKRMIQDWDLVRDLLDIFDTPVASENNIQLVIDQNIFNALETHLKFETVDLVNNPDKSPARELLVATLIESEEVEDSIRPVDDTEEASVAMLMPLSYALIFKELERVEVVWVESPSIFFIRRCEDFDLFEILKCQVEVESNEVMRKQDRVLVGQTAMVMCRGSVTRGRVDRIVQDTATVSYIDLGGSGHHPLAHLTLLSDQLSAQPGFSYQCCLANVSPPPGTSWSSQATKALTQATLLTTCLVSVLDSNTSHLIVSLYLQPGEGMARDHMCSLEEYLVYKGFADWNVGGCEEGHTSRRYSKNFLRLAPWRKGEEQQVVVAHIESPGCVHVQMLGAKGGYADSIRNLIVDMEKEYTRRFGDPYLKVLVPRVGMACVAQLKFDKKPHRVQVIDVLSDGRVEVQFLDFGNKEVIMANDLMKNLDKFLSLPVMSIAVCLAGIVPVQSIGWEQQAGRVLGDKTRGRKLSLFVEEEKTETNLFKVILYEMLLDKDVCINAWLVMEGYAISLTGECSTLEYQKEIIQEQASGDDNKVMIGQHIPGMSGDKNPEKVACRVVNAYSPSSLFIRQLSDEENFYNLDAAVQLHYKSMAPKEVKISPGSLCAANLGVKGWSRAKVVSMHGNMLELSLLDEGKKISLQVQNLRPLDNKFRFRNFVEEVHLVNLLPSGGTGKWTRAACEALDEILEEVNTMVYVEMAGKSLNGTAPVRMFVKKVQDSGVEFVPIDETLVKAGLAIPAVNRNMTSTERVKDSKPANDQVPQFQSLSSPSEDCSYLESISWPSPLPPPRDQFLAVASHVDWDGNIYLSPLTASQENDHLRIIGNVLESKYQDSTPRPVDKYWKVGQTAVTRWDLDGRWYRAKVLGVNFDECTVQFVDYGTVEECKVEDMRKDLFMTEFPIQCFPLQLQKVKPMEGKWEQPVLHFLHSTVVDQTVSVTIDSIATVADENAAKSYMGKLTTMAGLDIGQMLIEKLYARATESK